MFLLHRSSDTISATEAYRQLVVCMLLPAQGVSHTRWPAAGPFENQSARVLFQPSKTAGHQHLAHAAPAAQHPRPLRGPCWGARGAGAATVPSWWPRQRHAVWHWAGWCGDDGGWDDGRDDGGGDDGGDGGHNAWHDGWDAQPSRNAAAASHDAGAGAQGYNTRWAHTCAHRCRCERCSKQWLCSSSSSGRRSRWPMQPSSRCEVDAW